MPGPGVLRTRRVGRQAQQQQRERIWHQRLGLGSNRSRRRKKLGGSSPSSLSEANWRGTQSINSGSERRQSEVREFYHHGDIEAGVGLQLGDWKNRWKRWRDWKGREKIEDEEREWFRRKDDANEVRVLSSRLEEQEKEMGKIEKRRGKIEKELKRKSDLEEQVVWVSIQEVKERLSPKKEVIEKAKFGKAKRSLAGVCLARKGLRHRRIEPWDGCVLEELSWVTWWDG